MKRIPDGRKGRTGRSGKGGLLLFVGCLTSQQQASVSQRRICSDICTCCHTEIEVADQTFYLTQSQYTDTGPTSPRADSISPGAWQGCHWRTDFLTPNAPIPHHTTRLEAKDTHSLQSFAFKTNPEVSESPLFIPGLLQERPFNKSISKAKLSHFLFIPHRNWVLACKLLLLTPGS